MAYEILTEGLIDSEKSSDLIKGAMKFDGDPKKLREYYRDWSSTYDVDVSNEKYCGPEIITDFLLGLSDICDLEINTKNPNLSILDAGCGTGLVGKALLKRGYLLVDGGDLSPEMIECARKTGAYNELESYIDLTQRNTVYRNNQYDVVVCCGTFTGGHLPPTGLEELLRITKTQGLVVISTRKSYYDSTDFEATYIRLQQEKRLKLLHCLVEAPYLEIEDAHYFAFLVL